MKHANPMLLMPAPMIARPVMAELVIVKLVIVKLVIVKLVIAAVAIAALAACSNNQEAESAAPRANPLLQGIVPERMRSIQLHDRMVDRGRALFQQCITCHGADGEGRMGLGPSINSATFLAAADDDMLIRTIAKGRAGTTMVPWGQLLSRDDIYAIIAYMRSWQPIQPVALDQSPLQGDEARGQAVFASICSGCHGNNGAGYQETANGTGIGRQAFIREVSNGFLRYIIRNGKSQTQMKGFRERSRAAVADLTDQQIDDVIVYLRLNAW